MTEMNGRMEIFILVLTVVCFGVPLLFAGHSLDVKAQQRDAANYYIPQQNNIPQQSPENLYGCPGCPSSYMDFAEDMCGRVGSEYTVSDGTNTLKCSELGVKR